MYKAILLLVFTLALGIGLACHADAVYKWVDDQGNVHYTDHPHPGAKKVQLPKTQTYQSPAVNGGVLPAQNAAPQATEGATSGYKQLSITSPANDANLWYVDQVPVSVSITPALHNGDTLTYHLDDKSIGPTTDTTVTFKEVERGEHAVSVTLNSTSSTSLSAGPVKIFIHQKTIISPKPPH